jgi:hypothetical protein
MLSEGSRETLVLDEDGEPVGVLSLERVSDLLRDEVVA